MHFQFQKSALFWTSYKCKKIFIVQYFISHLPNFAHQIESQKLDWKAESKVGSMDNATHVAGGGDKKVSVTKNISLFLVLQ